MATPGAATTVLRTYHHRLAEMLDTFSSENGSDMLPPHMRGKLLLELVRHEIMESMHLFPAVTDVLPGADDIAGYGLAELRRIHELMEEVEAMPPEDTRFHDLATALRTEFQRHVEDQETSLFPRLEEAMSADELIRLGQRLNPTMSTGSTQAHPNTKEGDPPLLEPRPGLVNDLRTRVMASELTS